MSRLEQQETARCLRIERCGGEEASTKKLLDSGSMVTGLVTTTVCEVYDVNPAGMDDSKWFGTPLGVRTQISGMMAKLEDVSGFSE